MQTSDWRGESSPTLFTYQSVSQKHGDDTSRRSRQCSSLNELMTSKTKTSGLYKFKQKSGCEVTDRIHGPVRQGFNNFWQRLSELSRAKLVWLTAANNGSRSACQVPCVAMRSCRKFVSLLICELDFLHTAMI
ncbi:hypothetical protein ABVT39_025787 [Epinephelus coioides]